MSTKCLRYFFPGDATVVAGKTGKFPGQPLYFVVFDVEAHRAVVRVELQSTQDSPYWESSGSKGSPNETMASYSGPARPVNLRSIKQGFPILGVFRLKGQPKRDDGMIFGSCKASQSPVYPIRDAFLAVNHASCPSLSSSGPPPVG